MGGEEARHRNCENGALPSARRRTPIRFFSPSHMYGPGLFPSAAPASFQAQRIPFFANPDVQQAIDSIGRTEDIAFCPRNRRLALAAFSMSRLLVLDVHVPEGAPDGAIELRDHLWIHSPCLQFPHGLTWLDERTLVVANRQGQLSRFELPEASPARELRFEGDCRIAGAEEHLCAPGSVAARTLGPGMAEIFVCNNDAHHLTQHLFRHGEGVVSSSRLASWGLSIPDGVALSADGRWLAISNHNEHRVLVYENSTDLGPHSAPCASLQGSSYPHGLRFTPDGRYLVVADAGEPLVHVYARSGTAWRGTLQPVRQARVMSEDIFRRGRDNPQEGGPKGLDIDRSGRVLALTSREDPLSFFALAPMLDESPASGHGVPEESRTLPASAEHPQMLAVSLERHLAGLAREHRALRAQLQEACGTAEAQLREVQAQLREAEAQHRMLAGELAHCRQARDAAAQASEQWSAQLQDVRRAWQAEVAALRASRSWRITAPLRGLGRRVRRG